MINSAEVSKAYAGKDEFGVPVPLPDIKFLKSEIDANGDGHITRAEIDAWPGYQEKKFCSSMGDRSYGCKDRCVAGIDRANGFPGYFDSYNTQLLEGFDLEHDYTFSPLVGTNGKGDKIYNGQVSHAQEEAIVAALKHHEGKGHVAIFGLHYEPLWRSLYDVVKDTPNRHIYLFDTFEGEAACDHKYDTSMCPAAGSSKVSEEYVTHDIQSYGHQLDIPERAQRVKVHKGDYANAGKHIQGKVSFAVVDGRIYPTVSKMLKALAPHLHTGATIAVHDFGFEGYPGVEAAVREFNEQSGFYAVLPSSLDGVACYLAFLQKD